MYIFSLNPPNKIIIMLKLLAVNEYSLSCNLLFFNSHVTDGNLNGQHSRDEILTTIVVLNSIIWSKRYCPPIHCQNLQEFPWAEEGFPVLNRPPYSADMLPIKHLKDALDRWVCQQVRGTYNSCQLQVAVLDEWDNISQATIDHLVMSK